MVLVAAVTVATVVLAVTNQLQLYIHPRYILFTVIMVVIGGVVLVASLIVRASGEEDSEEAPGRASRAFSYIGLVLAAALAVGMLALPPATLTSATA